MSGLPPATGDCYEAAAMIAIGLPKSVEHEVVVCHGIAVGQGKIAGVRFGHAWIETADGRFVIEVANGRRVKLHREVFYEAGQINPEEVIRYPVSRVRKKMRRTGHCGPWDAASMAVA